MLQNKYLFSISKSLASSYRKSGPNIIIEGIEYPVGGQEYTDSDFGVKILKILYNLTPSELYEYGLREKDTSITSTGALSTKSGAKTGRCPNDKRIVLDENTKDIWWNKDGSPSPNREMDKNTFLINRETAICYLNSLDQIFVFDGFAGWSENKIKVRVISARAYHSLFMYNMLIRPTKEELDNFGDPDFVIYNSGEFPCNRYTGYMTSSTSIDFDFTRREIVILGTQYAGEMKKGIFTVMHYLMPKIDILSLHSSANQSKLDKSTTLFFGLSGTGKTTLSADQNRLLIGDDEHCWDNNGIFNIEGGCYAKCINLDKDREPDIWNAIRFGALLENVIVDPHTRISDFNDNSITENTRVSYPIEYIDNAVVPCVGTHPTNIILLTCDAFGLLPPVSKLDENQLMYYFISGYTAKIAGTEDGINEPVATFSACFGEAFLIWHPMMYAKLLADKMRTHKANAWLVNTGWVGGSYGIGKRCDIFITRKIIDSIHDGSLLNVEYEKLDIFGLNIPKECHGIDFKILNPKFNWSDPEKYLIELKKLSNLFVENFKKYNSEIIAKFGPNF